MPLSIRLDPATRAALDQAAAITGRSRSDIIRDALVKHLAQLDQLPEVSAYDRLAEYIGCVDSGGQDLSRATGRGFHRILEAKRARGPG